jgi:thiol-disulfide isomerase/thioredoxin
MKSTVIAIVSLLLSGSVFSQQSDGYNIEVNVKGLANTNIFLAYHMGDKQYIKDSVTLDLGGQAYFHGNKPLDQGVYIIILPGNRYFEFLIPEAQHFRIDCDINDLIASLRFTGSAENSEFAEFQKRWALMYQESVSLQKRITANRQNPDSLNHLSALSQKQQDTSNQYIKKIIDNNKTNLAGSLIRAMQPVELPDFNIPGSLPGSDSLRWVMTYNYNKDHFFDNLDLSDERLLRSPVFHSRIDYYFTGVILQFPDSLIKAIDKVIALSSGNKKTFQYVAVYLFNHFRESTIMGHDAVMVKVADEIYLSGKADWASKDFIDNLRMDIDRLRPSLIGNQAINITMPTLAHGTVSLHSIKKEFIVLYFWEPDCGHCKDATPILRDFYNRNRDKGVEVLSVCTQTKRDLWLKYISDNNLEWINGWDPDRSTHYDFFYNVVSTPTIFILDKDKRIIAKKLPAESVEAFIESYRKYGR